MTVVSHRRGHDPRPQKSSALLREHSGQKLEPVFQLTPASRADFDEIKNANSTD
jgi:hypothetical protein